MAAPEAVRVPNTNENEWNTAREAAGFAVKKSVIGVDCMKNIQLFSQHSGQCWSDTGSVMLLFTPGMGEKVQEKFQHSTIETLSEELNWWLILNRKWIELLAYDSEILKEDEMFKICCDLIVQYVICLYERYINWSEALAINKLPLHRTKSHGYSLCQESAGSLASELLSALSSLKLAMVKKEYKNFYKKTI